MKNMTPELIRDIVDARLALFLMPAVVVALLVFLLNRTEPVDPYCEMVGIWIETGGEYGWHDYRGNGECGDER